MSGDPRGADGLSSPLPGDTGPATGGASDGRPPAGLGLARWLAALALFSATALVVGVAWRLLLSVLLALLTGWVRLPARVLPRIQVEPGAVALALITAALLVALLHSFLRWLHDARSLPSDSPNAWRWRWTLACVAFLVLAFVAGTAAVGIVETGKRLTRSELIASDPEGVRSLPAVRVLGAAVGDREIDNEATQHASFRAWRAS